MSQTPGWRVRRHSTIRSRSWAAKEHGILVDRQARVRVEDGSGGQFLPLGLLGGGQLERLHVGDGEVGETAHGFDDLGHGRLLVGMQIELDARRAVTRHGAQLVQRDARLARVDLRHDRAQQAVIVERAHVDARDGRHLRAQAPFERHDILVPGDARALLAVHGEVDRLAVAAVDAADDLGARRGAAALGQVQLVRAQAQRARDIDQAQEFLLEEAVKDAVDGILAGGDGSEQIFLAGKRLAAHRVLQGEFHFFGRQVEAVMLLQRLEAIVDDLLAVVRAGALALQVALDGTACARRVCGQQPQPVRPRRLDIVLQLHNVEMVQDRRRLDLAPVDGEAPALLGQVRVHVVGKVDDRAAAVEGQQLPLRAEDVEALGQRADGRGGNLGVAGFGIHPPCPRR
ncbi:MAG: hypothetical protein M9936_27530 [Caldilinea sp.]|nr:hypothetical protein [Caldilinea sp.]